MSTLCRQQNAQNIVKLGEHFKLAKRRFVR